MVLGQITSNGNLNKLIIWIVLILVMNYDILQYNKLLEIENNANPTNLLANISAPY